MYSFLRILCELGSFEQVEQGCDVTQPISIHIGVVSTKKAYPISEVWRGRISKQIAAIKSQQREGDCGIPGSPCRYKYLSLHKYDGRGRRPVSLSQLRFANGRDRLQRTL